MVSWLNKLAGVNFRAFCSVSSQSVGNGMEREGDRVLLFSEYIKNHTKI